jgi:putative endonuclease
VLVAEGGDLRQRRGRTAERLAELHVLAAGLEVVARNFRCRAGELDLICSDGRNLIVVEVRQRSRREFGGPLASIGSLKQRRIRRTTEYFRLRSPQWADRPVRFDVVAVLGQPDAEHELIWIKDAFRV